MNTAYAADIDKAEIIKKVAAGTTLSDDEKNWFNSFFSGTTLQYQQYDPKGTGGYIFHSPYTVRLQSNSDGGVILGGDGNVGTTKTAAYVFGTDNTYSSHASIHGFDNVALGYNAISIGEQNKTIGSHGVSIGGQNMAGSGSLALGFYAFAKNQSNALGVESTALGNTSTAIGSGAIAGKKAVLDYKKNIDMGYNDQPYYAELQKMAPELFGTYTEETKYDEKRFEEARTKIYDLYKDYLKKFGINSLNELKALDNGTDVDPILQALGFQYYLTRDNIESAVAIGTGAHALEDNTLSLGRESEALVKGSVGLGAFSRATEDDMVKDGTKAPFSNVLLSSQGSTVGTHNEYLLGHVSIGGKDATDSNKFYLRQLKYLADGTDDTDAVNVRQLKEAMKNGGSSDGGGDSGGGTTGSSIVYEAGENITITDKEGSSSTKIISATGMTEIKEQVNDMGERVNTMDGWISKLDSRVDKVGAGAAALAALHPLDYDPDDKLDVAAGYGHYAGASAVALGAYYRPNEDIMFSIGGSFGNGENMLNAGVSVKVGPGKSNTTTSKAAMSKRIQELQQVTSIQQEKLAEQDARLAAQEAEIQELKEMIRTLVK